MSDHLRVYFERERLPARRVLDPFDPSTHELEAPVIAFEARHAMSRTFQVQVELEVDLARSDRRRRATWRRSRSRRAHRSQRSGGLRGILGRAVRVPRHRDGR